MPSISHGLNVVCHALLPYYTLLPATGIIPILTDTLWRDSFPLCMTVICNLNNLQKGIWWSEVRPNWAVLGSYNDALVGGEEEGEG